MGNRCCGRGGEGQEAELVVSVLGLDGAGKTSLVRVLRGESLEGLAPTIGFGASQLRRGDARCELYDLGGGARIRDIWPNYYAESFGLVFVVDAGDRERLDEAGQAFTKLLPDPRIRGKPLLVLLNKADVPGTVDEVEFSDLLHLQTLVNTHKTPVRIELCSTHKGTGPAMDPRIEAGVAWLFKKINDNMDVLRERVGKDKAAQEAQREVEKVARARRVELARQAREAEEAAHAPNGTADPSQAQRDSGLKGTRPFRPLPDIMEEGEELSVTPQPRGDLDHSDSEYSRATVPKLPPIASLTPAYRHLPPLNADAQSRGPKERAPSSTSASTPTPDPFLTRQASGNGNAFAALPPRAPQDPGPTGSARLASAREEAGLSGRQNGHLGRSSDEAAVSDPSSARQRQRKRKRLRRFHKTAPTASEDSEDNVHTEHLALQRLPSSEPTPPSPDLVSSPRPFQASLRSPQEQRRSSQTSLRPELASPQPPVSPDMMKDEESPVPPRDPPRLPPLQLPPL